MMLNHREYKSFREGMTIEDVAWGYDCYKKALELGIGTKLNLWDEPYMK